MIQDWKIDKVVGSRVIVRVVEHKEEKTQGGIIIANAEARKELFPYEAGEIIFAGDKDEAVNYTAGDKVLISHMAPRNPVKKGETEDGETFRDWVLFAHDITAVLK